MFRKIKDVVLFTMFVILMTTGIFTAGYITGKPPVTKQEIVEATDSLQKSMLEAYDKAE